MFLWTNERTEKKTNYLYEFHNCFHLSFTTKCVCACYSIWYSFVRRWVHTQCPGHNPLNATIPLVLEPALVMHYAIKFGARVRILFCFDFTFICIFQPNVMPPALFHAHTQTHFNLFSLVVAVCVFCCCFFSFPAVVFHMSSPALEIFNYAIKWFSKSSRFGGLWLYFNKQKKKWVRIKMKICTRSPVICFSVHHRYTSIDNTAYSIIHSLWTLSCTRSLICNYDAPKW